MSIGYRPYGKRDRQAVSTILYRTGFLGEDLDGTGRFNDRRLFSLVNTEGYLRYQEGNGFVAVDDSDEKVVGYIIGTADSVGYDRLFKRRMYWRMALRGFVVSWWRYPESFRQVLTWAREYSDAAERFFPEFPAHLHINVLPEYQRLGIGERLIRLFEERMAAQGVPGIHLGTSNRNRKAIPFYEKNGYHVLVERPETYWRGVEGHTSVIFGKRLSGKT
jgi:ribosomal protein S18 acetylase RimI-like enzyme